MSESIEKLPAKSLQRKKVIAAIIDSFAVAFPKDVPKDLKAVILVWSEILKPYNLKLIQKAANHILSTRTETWWPAPAEIVNLVRPKVPNSSEAWSEIVACLPTWSDYGGGEIVKNTVAHRVVETLGGYHALSMMNADQLQWQQKRFNEYYQSFASKSDLLKLNVPQTFKEILKIKTVPSPEKMRFERINILENQARKLKKANG